VVNTLDTATK